MGELRRTLVCAYCDRRKPFPDAYPKSHYAECWTCWLRKNPEAVEHIRKALGELERRPNG